MSSTQPSLTGRAILAVILLIGFYALAFLIIAVLLFILYAMIVYGQRINIRVALFTVIGAGLVLWSIFPRPDRFVPPGLLVEVEDQPNFFETVEEVSRATEQDMPVEVYLVSDVNAWVTNRGEVMGFGSRRVMGVGLPLLQILTVSQFRAVLAHEFGHYYGGDTKLGPWIYKTRGTIGRTIANLSQHSSLLQKPFLWYGTIFLRITQAVSRQQEFAADLLACRVVGAGPLVDGLKKVHGSAMAFDIYWNHELSPVLKAGFHPPLAEGFANYLRTPTIIEAIDKATEKSLDQGKTNPYDTHPPLKRRIEAVSSLPKNMENQDESPAITLLDNVPKLETQLFAMLAKMNNLSKFKPLAWEDVGLQIYLPAWREFARKEGSYLSGITPASLPEIAKNIDDFARRFPASSPEERRSQAHSLIGAALAIKLHELGWTLHSSLNEQVYFSINDLEMFPFRIVEDLENEKVQPEEWLQMLRPIELSELDLSKVGGKSTR